MASAQRAEALGYDRLVIPDHFGAGMAIAPALVLAAQSTTRIRVGSFVYDNDFRHPALLAQEIATIDLLTDGRFDFGIGAGWLKSEYDAAGLSFDPGRARVERLAEALQIITRLLAGRARHLRGRALSRARFVRRLRACPAPAPAHRAWGWWPPASHARGRTCRRDQRDAEISARRQRSRECGRQPGGIPAEGRVDPGGGGRAIPSTRAEYPRSGGDDHQQRTERSRTSGTQVDGVPEELLDSPLFLIGTVEEVAATLDRRCELLGLTSITVFEKDLDNLADVIERVRLGVTGAPG